MKKLINLLFCLMIFLLSLPITTLADDTFTLEVRSEAFKKKYNFYNQKYNKVYLYDITEIVSSNNSYEKEINDLKYYLDRLSNSELDKFLSNYEKQEYFIDVENNSVTISNLSKDKVYILFVVGNFKGNDFLVKPAVYINYNHLKPEYYDNFHSLHIKNGIPIVNFKISKREVGSSGLIDRPAKSALFSLYEYDGVNVGSGKQFPYLFEADENGEIKLDLSPGHYYLVEERAASKNVKIPEEFKNCPENKLLIDVDMDGNIVCPDDSLFVNGLLEQEIINRLPDNWDDTDPVDPNLPRPDDNPDDHPFNSIKFVKVDNRDNSLRLPDAMFKVMNEEKQWLKNSLDNTFTENKDEASIFISDENGEFEINGLKEGRYYIVEIYPPKGYGTLAEPVEFFIDDKIHEPIVIQNKRFVIPETGTNSMIKLLTFLSFSSFMAVILKGVDKK